MNPYGYPEIGYNGGNSFIAWLMENAKSINWGEKSRPSSKS